jgi:uncharacterized membrane protein YeaQ/YmgE (transglycosylase-associated protein family)
VCTSLKRWHHEPDRQEAITGFNLTTLLVATAGAVLVLVVYGMIKKR